MGHARSDDPLGVVWRFAPDCRSENAVKLLNGLHGTVHLDDEQGSNRVTRTRRKVTEVFNRGDTQIIRTYAVDKDIRGMSPGQRLSAHDIRATLLVESFSTEPQAQHLRAPTKRSHTSTKTGPDCAFFPTAERLEISPNSVRNVIRPITAGPANRVVRRS